MAESCTHNGNLKELKMKDSIKAEKRCSRDDVHNYKNAEHDKSACNNAKIKLKKDSKESKIKAKKAIELENDNNVKDKNSHIENNDDFESKCS